MYAANTHPRLSSSEPFAVMYELVIVTVTVTQAQPSQARLQMPQGRLCSSCHPPAHPSHACCNSPLQALEFAKVSEHLAATAAAGDEGCYFCTRVPSTKVQNKGNAQQRAEPYSTFLPLLELGTLISPAGAAFRKVLKSLLVARSRRFTDRRDDGAGSCQ